MLLGASGLFREGVWPVPESGGARPSAPDFDDVEADRNSEKPAGLPVGVRATDQMPPLVGVHRQERGDLVQTLVRTHPSGFDFHKAQLPGTAQGNQVDLAAAMERPPVACEAVISAIFQVASRGVFAGSAYACAQPSQARRLRRK